MDHAEALRLRGVLSQARLGEYVAVCGGDTVAALRLFCWNTEIASGLYGPLQHLELALRSVIDQQLRRLFGQADWWDAPGADLHFGARQKIADARGQLRRQSIPATPQEIVNELPFGFWVGLLGSGNRYDQRLWRTALHRAFPHHRGRRRDLHQKLDYLRVLRNKIAHHCPIHHRHLHADYETIVEVLGYIDHGLAGLVRRYSGVPALLARRPPTA
ncbi:hypothetical protein [Sphaerisporangium rhizosphaerae]|uniref:Abi-like protein n=1 Tax=Sphaerisporangium rhizosphaerae TaxID=2269375 RepID=A0ABW2NXB4_9ACTN